MMPDSLLTSISSSGVRKGLVFQLLEEPHGQKDRPIYAPILLKTCPLQTLRLASKDASILKREYTRKRGMILQEEKQWKLK
ncbi:hypothetical protein [Methanocella conradii]|uniref:hypothetical protein n=1 Tax=Methanocella conradii TaxID=1175444 RepID=UPI00064EA480|nr:hypothetical protein [Methanocella conradii]